MHELLDRWLRVMVDKRASDLHLSAGLPPQYRVDGALMKAEGTPLSAREVQDLVFSLLNQGQVDAFLRDKELDFSFGLPGVSRFRVNVFYQRGSVACALRYIAHRIPTVEELGLPPILKEFCDQPNGLLLVTGATGSGKSTTLAAGIEFINQTRRCHIVTIEDPIEYFHNHGLATIDQREVGSDTHSFAEALRHVFRQDPDVVLIGEMRDLETIHTALSLAETGHLILATLHTSDTVHSISRIIDVFPAHQQQQIRVQLSMTLLGVISQRLLPRANKSGRVVACEVLRVTPGASNIIRENQLPQLYSLLQTGRKYGMCSMNQALADMCNMKLITTEDASRMSNDLNELQTLMQTHSRD